MATLAVIKNVNYYLRYDNLTMYKAIGIYYYCRYCLGRIRNRIDVKIRPKDS